MKKDRIEYPFKRREVEVDKEYLRKAIMASRVPHWSIQGPSKPTTYFDYKQSKKSTIAPRFRNLEFPQWALDLLKDGKSESIDNLLNELEKMIEAPKSRYQLMEVERIISSLSGAEDLDERISSWIKRVREKVLFPSRTGKKGGRART